MRHVYAQKGFGLQGNSGVAPMDKREIRRRSAVLGPGFAMALCAFSWAETPQMCPDCILHCESGLHRGSSMKINWGGDAIYFQFSVEILGSNLTDEISPSMSCCDGGGRQRACSYMCLCCIVTA